MEKYTFLNRISDLRNRIAQSNVETSFFNHLFEQYDSMCLDLELLSSGPDKASKDLLLALQKGLKEVENEIIDLEKNYKAIVNRN
ncbi:hypothetical protein [Flavobacterium sp.]|uniref:hypothetical protein n=1 Tax=Flavobacterium sp. TaxID=239 RepID=UPI003263E2F7